MRILISLHFFLNFLDYFFTQLLILVSRSIEVEANSIACFFYSFFGTWGLAFIKLITTMLVAFIFSILVNINKIYATIVLGTSFSTSIYAVYTAVTSIYIFNLMIK